MTNDVKAKTLKFKTVEDVAKSVAESENQPCKHLIVIGDAVAEISDGSRWTCLYLGEPPLGIHVDSRYRVHAEYHADNSDNLCVQVFANLIEYQPERMFCLNCGWFDGTAEPDPDTLIQ